jgi:phosphoribulokinase
MQRDMLERGWTEEEIKASIEQRKPDFSAYIDPQKKNADVILQVLPTKLTNDPSTAGKLLRVRLIQKEGNSLYNPYYLGPDKEGDFSWTPSQAELSTDPPGVKFDYYHEDWYGQKASVLECDGEYKDIQ